MRLWIKAGDENKGGNRLKFAKNYTEIQALPQDVGWILHCKSKYLGYGGLVDWLKLSPSVPGYPQINEQLSTGVVNRWIGGKTREMGVCGWPISLAVSHAVSHR